MSQLLQLRRDVRIIPMVNRWYATPYLIPPLTFALTMQNSHLPLLRSFVESPDTHRECAAMPSLRGGPFVDHRGAVSEVEEFIASTERVAAPRLEQAQLVGSLFDQLMEQARGGSLDGLYAAPAMPLSGCYELVYDVCHQPSVRFIEPVLYRRFSVRALQSCRLEPIDGAERPFILSTPILGKTPAAVDIEAPFASPLWDLLSARSGRHDWEQLAALLSPHLADPERDLPALAALFEPAAPAPHADRPAAGSVRIRYFGHACVLVESATTNILIDPLVSYPGETAVDGYTLDDLPAHIDYVLITHPHADHLVLETLLQLRHKIGTVVVGKAGGGGLPDISPALLLRDCGFERVVSLGEYEELPVAGGCILGAPFYGEHGELDIRSKLVFGIQLFDQNLVFMADSNPPSADCYLELRERLGSIDYLFLGMECVGAPVSWAYGALLRTPLQRAHEQSRRLNGSDAQRAADLRAFFMPANTFVYAMGAEPWVTHISSIVRSDTLPQFVEAARFVRQAGDAGHHAELLYGQREVVVASPG